MSEVIPEAEAYLRFRLGEMSTRNEHHRFEELATRVAQKRISSNVLIATGPVSAGGDQQRDAESYYTRIPDELPHASGFAANATTTPVVIACTVQSNGLRQKVLDDLAGICAAGASPVEHVAFFTVHPISEGHTHALQKTARETYGVELDIFCGADIATLLLQHGDLVWAAQHYLDLPTSLVPPPDSEPAPEWYTELIERLRLSGGPKRLTPGAQGEVTEALRFATWDEDANADLPEWLTFMSAFLTDTEADGSDSEMVFRACYEMAVARFRGTGVAADIEDLVRRALVFASTSTDMNVVDDAVTLASYWGTMWTTGVARAEASEIEAALQGLRDHVADLLASTDPDTHPVRAASLTGTLAFSHLVPNWEFAEATLGKPEPAERAANAGVRLDELQVDANALERDDFVGLDAAMEYFDKLIDLLPGARVYSVRQLAVVFNMFAPLAVDHPSYVKVRDGLDASTAAAQGDAATAEKCRDRGTAFVKTGRPLQALLELHNAKVHWFQGDTMYGSILTMRFIAKLYADLGLMYAAKMYSCAAATLGMMSSDTDVTTQVPKALLETAAYAQQAGTWVDAALTEIALLGRAQYHPEGFDYDKNPQLANHETNATLELTGIRNFWPDIEPLIEAAHPTTEWYQRLVEVVAYAAVSFKLTEDEFQASAAAQLAGPVLGDVGESRVIDFSALGIRWTFTFDNDQTTVLTAEGIVATLQVLLADIATMDPVLIPATVHTTIDVTTGTNHADDNIDIDDSDTELVAHITSSDDLTDIDARDRHVLSMCTQLLHAVHVRPPEELQNLIESLFKGGIVHKISIGRPYEETARLIDADHYVRCAAATRPASSTTFRPTERPPLAASTRRGPGYDQAEALQIIGERYEVANDALRFTLPRILADAEGRATIQRLRDEGWLDWQVLVAFVNAAMNWKVRQAAIQPGSGDQKPALDLAREPETAQSPPIPVGVFTGDHVNMLMFMQTVTVARRWDLRGRNEGPDEHAMRDLLNRRYRYAVDDIPHRDLLDCVAEDGTLLSLLEPGDGIDAGGL